MKVFDIIIATTIASVITAMVVYVMMFYVILLGNIEDDFSNFDRENICIQQLVAQGVDRANIKRGEGTCSLDYSE